jgi:hypothetical protein
MTPTGDIAKTRRIVINKNQLYEKTLPEHFYLNGIDICFCPET